MLMQIVPSMPSDRIELHERYKMTGRPLPTYRRWPLPARYTRRTNTVLAHLIVATDPAPHGRRVSGPSPWQSNFAGTGYFLIRASDRRQ